MRALTLLICATVLSGCAAKLAAKDDERCKAYGLAFGTPAYADCRLRLLQMREGAASGAAYSSSVTNCQKAGNTVSCQSY
jgi:hypothetical protein